MWKPPQEHAWTCCGIRQVVARIFLIIFVSLIACLPGRAGDEFRFPKAIAQELKPPFDALQQGDWKSARSLADEFVSKHEQRLPSVSDEKEDNEIRQGLKAASIISAIARHQSGDFRSLSEVLEKRRAWHKQTSGNFAEIVNTLINIQYHLNSFIVGILVGDFDAASMHLIHARKIGDAFPNEQSVDMGSQLGFFRMMTSMATYLFTQKTGTLPQGDGWLEPVEIDKSVGVNRNAFIASELMRSVALSRIGRSKAAADVLQTISLDVGDGDIFQAIILFHRGCMLASEGNKADAIDLLRDAEARAKKVGQFLPVSAMISASNGSDANSIWPSELVPTSDRYLLKIIPRFKLNIDVDFSTYDDQEFPASFKENFGPGFFLNFAS